MGIVLEETDETLFWLETDLRNRDNEKTLLDALMKECKELVAIFVASLNTAKRK